MLEIAEKENSDLVKEISNSKAIIQNMHSEIAKFHNDTAAFSLMHDSTTTMPSKEDSIDKNEHDSVVKKLNDTLSKTLAENLEILEMVGFFFFLKLHGNPLVVLFVRVHLSIALFIHIQTSSMFLIIEERI